jgi:hypothetical protein
METVAVIDEAFAEAAVAALGHLRNEPVELATGQQIVPRDFLRALAVKASDWPCTAGEISYHEMMKECFWALVYERPASSTDWDERSMAENLAFGVLLAMLSADRGGYRAAADLCQTALAYMATLRAWRDVGIQAAAQGVNLVIDLTRPDHDVGRAGEL